MNIRFRIQRRITTAELLFVPIFYRSTGIVVMYYDPTDDWDNDETFQIVRARLLDRLGILYRILTEVDGHRIIRSIRMQYPDI